MLPPPYTKHSTSFFWTGFYMLHPDGMLRLGPFQGPPACYAIAIGKGVCGKAFEAESTLVVPDVEQFPGHIACSALSRSEIVVPIFSKVGKCVGVLDIDSTQLGTFDATDKLYLEQVAQQLTRTLY